jgi:2'-5' RNA ligase
MQNNRPTQIRAFLAIDLSIEVKAILHQVIDQLKITYPQTAIRWIQPENLHITLHFIASLKVMDIQSLLENLNNKAKEIKPFAISLTNLMLFPSEIKPTVIAMNMTHPHQIDDLVQHTGQIIAAKGYPIEKRLFSPHLTLGRIKNTKLQFSLDKIPLPTFPEVQIDQIILFQSEPRKEQPKYTPIELIPLR